MHASSKQKRKCQQQPPGFDIIADRLQAKFNSLVASSSQSSPNSTAGHVRNAHSHLKMSFTASLKGLPPPTTLSSPPRQRRGFTMPSTTCSPCPLA
mmetsp:Transcript_31067/g.57579  ORF Transcript_31067/g.57579 Transcript_31067/m.57579 type:complete len:96 (-) Transcript_31067:1268-1555(-)